MEPGIAQQWVDRINAVLKEAEKPMTPEGVATTIIARLPEGDTPTTPDTYQNLQNFFGDLARWVMIPEQDPVSVKYLKRLLAQERFSIVETDIPEEKHDK
tara:strand:+ start:19767 stop:20066 length:300 start_codon:yes stop_codon:yes gene_type:complete